MSPSYASPIQGPCFQVLHAAVLPNKTNMEQIYPDCPETWQQGKHGIRIQLHSFAKKRWSAKFWDGTVVSRWKLEYLQQTGRCMNDAASPQIFFDTNSLIYFAACMQNKWQEKYKPPVHNETSIVKLSCHILKRLRWLTFLQEHQVTTENSGQHTLWFHQTWLAGKWTNYISVILLARNLLKPPLSSRIFQPAMFDEAAVPSNLSPAVSSAACLATKKWFQRNSSEDGRVM